MNKVELFKKKMSILSRVHVEDKLNFGKLYREGALEVKTLEVLDSGHFPYHWDCDDKEEQQKEDLKINWEDDKDERGYAQNNVWSTYKECTTVTLYWNSEGEVTVEVHVYNGDMLDGNATDLRFKVEFLIKDLTIFIDKYNTDVNSALTRHAKYIREKEIKEEEAAKVLAIENNLLGE